MTKTAHTTTIEWRPATEPGALSGWEMTCTCGNVISTSLSLAAAARIGDQHLAWHAR